jgi:hypothetical protein
MAQAISERLLQRALGPVDLSYAYQKIDAVSRQLAAEDRLRKQEAAKQYYTEMASMNKDKAGIRAIDTPEISKQYSEWSNIGKKLSNNPTLITKNPEQYGRLKSEQDALESKLLTNIRASKELGKQEVKDLEDMLNPKNIDYYEPGAATLYRQDVINQPISAIIASGSNDKARYFAKAINGDEFYKAAQQAIPSEGVQKAWKISDPAFKDAFGRTRQIEYGDMPLDAKIKNVFTDRLYLLKGRAGTFANQELDKAIESKDFDNVVARYNSFYDPANKDGYIKYGIPGTPALKFDNTVPKTELFVNYLTAREVMNRLPMGVVTQAKFGDKEGIDYRNQLAMNRALTLQNRQQALKENASIYSPQEEIEAIAAAELGPQTRQAAIDFTEKYNKMFSGEKIFPFVAADASTLNGTPYETALDLVRSAFDKKNKLIIVAGDNSVTANRKKEELAKLINIKNKEYGVPFVTGKDLTDGKVFVKQIPVAGGEPAVIVYPIRDKQAVAELSNGVILSQMTPEQKRKYVETGFTGGGAKQTKPPQVQLSQPKVKTIKQSDVAAKAKAGGYTTSEYEALLRKNNVKIIK